MKVFKTKNELKTHFRNQFSKNLPIGFVPTMGSLHNGHLSLIQKSKKNNLITVASIFVNPTQFDKKEDLKKYPRALKQDLSLLEQSGCDIVFIPSVKEIYNRNIVSTHFDFDGLENEMEGKFRKGHFDGVGTIIKTFFEIINPTRSYFGEKDFQQLQIIKKMVAKNNLSVEVVGCPIHREENGLAMSSRNERLSTKQRKEAAIIYQVLKKVQEKFSVEPIEKITNFVTSQFEKHPLFKLEYFVIADENSLKKTTKILPKENYRAFIAVFTESIRLIDNLSLNS